MCTCEPRESILPFLIRFWEFAHCSHTQHRIWEYVNFCLHELDQFFVVHHGQLLPCRISLTQFWHSRYHQLFLRNQFQGHVEQFLYSWFQICISDGAQILGVTFPKKYRSMHRRRQEQSPNKRVLFNFFHLYSWRTIQYRSYSLIHFFSEWDWCGRKNNAVFRCLQIDLNNWILNDKSPCTCRNSLFGPNAMPRVHRARHRVCIWMPHLRIFYCITFSEVLLCVSWYGSRRACFESHFVIFRYEVAPGFKVPSMMALLNSLHGFSIPNFLLVSIWRRLFPHSHLPLVSSPWLQSTFESWKSLHSTNTEGGSILHVWRVLWSECLRADSWCRHTWFESWGLN